VRPGEKLFEELSTSGEDMTKTRHPKIYIGKIQSFPLRRIEAVIGALEEITDSGSKSEIRKMLGEVIPELETPEAEKHGEPQPRQGEGDRE
jgi:FlaA1/EpsC-like NDP-sugar epimerase